MGTRIGPMYRQFEREAKRLRENGAGAEADKLDGQASQMRLNRTSNIAASGENQAERAGYAAGQAGLVESQRRSQLEQQKLDREAQAQTTRLTAAQAGALESQNRGGTGTGVKPSIAPNSSLASTPRPNAVGGAINGGSPFYNPDSGVSATQSPASARPSLAAQPRDGITPEEKTRIAALRGKTDAAYDAADASDNARRKAAGLPELTAELRAGSIADLRKTDAGSRQDAIDAARNESAGNASVTRGSVIDRINKEREAKGLTPFGDDIYKDIAKKDISRAEQGDGMAKAMSADAKIDTAGLLGINEVRPDGNEKVTITNLANAREQGAAQGRFELARTAITDKLVNAPNGLMTPEARTAYSQMQSTREASAVADAKINVAKGVRDAEISKLPVESTMTRNEIALRESRNSAARARLAPTPNQPLQSQRPYSVAPSPTQLAEQKRRKFLNA